MSSTSDTPLCQAQHRGFSYKTAASSGSFQVAIRRMHLAINGSLSAFLLAKDFKLCSSWHRTFLMLYRPLPLFFSVGVWSSCAWLRIEHTKHSHEFPCFYVGFFQVFLSPADYRCWVSGDWNSESVDCCPFVLARELAPQNHPHSVSVLGGGFAAYLFAIVAEWL